MTVRGAPTYSFQWPYREFVHNFSSGPQGGRSNRWYEYGILTRGGIDKPEKTLMLGFRPALS